MNETLTADKGKVIKAYNKATGKRKVLLENLFGIKTFQLEIKERIKTFDDVLREVEMSKEDFETSCIGLEPDEVAYKKAKLVCKAYNENWQPDWTNSNEGKYYPWFKIGSSSGVGFSFRGCGVWCAASTVGSRLCFKSSDLATHAGKLFEQEIYKPLFTI